MAKTKVNGQNQSWWLGSVLTTVTDCIILTLPSSEVPHWSTGCILEPTLLTTCTRLINVKPHLLQPGQAEARIGGDCISIPPLGTTSEFTISPCRLLTSWLAIEAKLSLEPVNCRLLVQSAMFKTTVGLLVTSTGSEKRNFSLGSCSEHEGLSLLTSAWGFGR